MDPARLAGGGVLLFLLCGAAAFSQPLVYLEAVGSPPEAKLGGVVTGTAKLELMQAGLKPVGSRTAHAPASSDRTFVLAAKESGSPFLFLVRYTSTPEAVVMDLSFVDVTKDRIVKERHETLPLSLDLDSRVASAVQRLIEDPSVREAIARVPHTPERAAPPGGAGTVGTPVRPQMTERSSWAFTFSGQASPLLLVGGGSTYFRYGADVSFFGGVQLPVSRISLQTGVQLGATQLFPVPGLLPGSAYLFLAGLEARVGTPPPATVRIGARAGGGAAVIMVQMQGGSPQATTVPFVDGGVAASVRIVGAVALGVELGYLAVFESEYPVMGLAPALTVGTSW